MTAEAVGEEEEEGGVAEEVEAEPLAEARASSSSSLSQRRPALLPLAGAPLLQSLPLGAALQRRRQRQSLGLALQHPASSLGRRLPLQALALASSLSSSLLSSSLSSLSSPLSSSSLPLAVAWTRAGPPQPLLH